MIDVTKDTPSNGATGVALSSSLTGSIFNPLDVPVRIEIRRVSDSAFVDSETNPWNGPFSIGAISLYGCVANTEYKWSCYEEFDGNFGDDGEYTFTTAGGVVATPTININGGSFNNNQSITLSCSTSGASIYYTTNGTTPTAGSTLYTGAFSFGTTGAVIKAIGIKSGSTDSAVFTSNAFTFTVSSVSVSLAAGTYYAAKNVTATIATTTGASIYYTTNGSTPTSGSTLYTGPIAISTSMTLKTIGIKSNYVSSGVTSNAYVFNIVTGNYIAVRSSGTSPSQPTAAVVSNFESMSAAIKDMYPLTKNYTILLQGGMVIGQDATNSVMSNTNAGGNNYTITIMTDPGELSNTATIVGRVTLAGDASPTNLVLSKMKLRFDNPSGFVYGNSGSGSGDFRIEDCIMAGRLNGNGANFVYVKAGKSFKINNTLVSLTLTSGTFSAAAFSGLAPFCVLTNSTVYVKATSGFTLNGVDASSHHNVVYNASGAFAMAGTKTVGDPGLVCGALVTTTAESPTTILARDARLAVGSICNNAADPATASATDILGIARKF